MEALDVVADSPHGTCWSAVVCDGSVAYFLLLVSCNLLRTTAAPLLPSDAVACRIRMCVDLRFDGYQFDILPPLPPGIKVGTCGADPRADGGSLHRGQHYDSRGAGRNLCRPRGFEESWHFTF